MAGLVEAFKSAATLDVEAAGFWWRIRRVRSSDLAEVGVAMLAIAPGDPARATKGAKGAKAPAAAPRAPTAAELRDAWTHSETLVCAALVGVSADGAEWEALRAVLKPEAGDHDAGAIWVGDLPPGVCMALSAEILKFATDMGAAQERVASFRAGPRAVAPGRRGGA